MIIIQANELYVNKGLIKKHFFQELLTNLSLYKQKFRKLKPNQTDGHTRALVWSGWLNIKNI